MKTKNKTGRVRIETAIAEIITPVLAAFPDARFNVLGCELWRDADGGWSFNDAFRIASETDLAGVQSAARGRWEVFKTNYMPRARVADVECLEYIPGDQSIYVECAGVSFLEIRPL
jgi:hypothetical protein